MTSRHTASAQAPKPTFRARPANRPGRGKVRVPDPLVELIGAEGRDAATAVPEFHWMLANQLSCMCFCDVLVATMGHVEAPHDASIVPTDQCLVVVHLVVPNPSRPNPRRRRLRKVPIMKWNLGSHGIRRLPPIRDNKSQLIQIRVRACCGANKRTLVGQTRNVAGATEPLTRVFPEPDSSGELHHHFGDKLAAPAKHTPPEDAALFPEKARQRSRGLERL